MNIEQIIGQLNRDRLALDENETTLTVCDDDRNTWRAWSNDPVMLRRLAKVQARIIKYDQWGVYFKLNRSQVRLFNPISDEQRAQMVEHGRQAAANLVE